MKRLFILLFAVTLLFSTASVTGAAYIQIGDQSNLTLEGLSNYSVTSLTDSFYLTPADGPRRVDFFEVTFESFDVGFGSATASIDFVFPEINNVQGVGVYGGIFTASFQLGALSWNDNYLDIKYGNNGLLRLALFDLAGLHIGDTVTIPGSIETIRESTATPIPGALLLLASGLIGVVGYRSVLEKRSRFQP